MAQPPGLGAGDGTHLLCDPRALGGERPLGGRRSRECAGRAPLEGRAQQCVAPVDGWCTGGRALGEPACLQAIERALELGHDLRPVRMKLSVAPRKPAAFALEIRHQPAQVSGPADPLPAIRERGVGAKCRRRCPQIDAAEPADRAMAPVVATGRAARGAAAHHDDEVGVLTVHRGRTSSDEDRACARVPGLDERVAEGAALSVERCAHLGTEARDADRGRSQGLEQRSDRSGPMAVDGHGKSAWDGAGALLRRLHVLVRRPRQLPRQRGLAAADGPVSARLIAGRAPGQTRRTRVELSGGCERWTRGRSTSSMPPTPSEHDHPRESAAAERNACSAEQRRGGLDDRRADLESELAMLRRSESAMRSELERVRRELAAAGRDLARARDLARERRRESEQALATAIVGLRSVRGDIERLGASTAWRLGHGAARAADRLRRRRRVTDGAVVAALARIDGLLERLSARRGEAPSGPGGAAPTRTSRPSDASPSTPELAARVRDAIGPVPQRASWPGVSLLVLNRNGAALLPGLLEGLRLTDYPTFELVVVDHASTDHSLALLEAARPALDVRIERKSVNLTFAAASNEAATLARHPLLLLLNNDVVPFEPGWLKELVDGLLGAQLGAIGATLLRSIPPPRAERPPSGVAVQHRGIRFGRRRGQAHPFNVDDGEDLFAERFGIETPCIAATGACLLIGADTFESIGGLDAGYCYGLEDVDLGLTLRAAGHRVACSGRAVLFHDEGATQRLDDRESRRLSRLVNERRLADRWGPALRRELRLALIRRDPDWVGQDALHIAIARVSNDPAHGGGDHFTALELGTALTDIGWRVSYVQRRDDGWYDLPADVDVVLALTDDLDARRLPSWVTAVAWIRNWTERWLARPWLDRYDLVLASSTTIADLVADHTGREAVLFPLAANPARFAPGPAVPAFAADYVFTGNRWGEQRAIESALAPRRGERVAVYGRGWDEVAAMRRHTRGPIAYDELPAVYASASVVVDDTAGPTLPYDAVNARVFEALLSGTPVITNGADGVHALFDADFPVWSDGATLRAGLDHLLGDDARRAELAERYRRTVLREHTYAHRARTLADAVVACEEQLSFCLKVGAPSWEQAERWGDLHVARDLQRALKRHGSRCLIQVLPEWDDLEATAYDIVVHLRGRSSHTPRPGQFNVLWLISHPDELTDEEAGAYDLVCVASRSHADALRQRVAAPVAYLAQASDPRRFRRHPDALLAHELVFVANTRGVRRRLLEDLLPTERDLAVWGSGWTGTPAERHVRGEWFDNDQLHRLYSSAAIVLCDHWDDMRSNGFASNRLYDALACGALVVSDAVSGVADELGDAVVTYDGADDLRRTIDRLLADERERRRRTARARETILAGHTFDHRAAELLELVREHAPSSGHRARVAPAR